MKTISGSIVRGVLAMAGKRGPWGGGDKGRPEGGAKGDGPGDDPDNSGDDSPGGDEPPRGPRNPWLPPESTPPRRSASLEDLFRPKGGGGRPGGGGGFGGGFPGLPPRPDGKSWTPLIVGGLVLVWLFFSVGHMLGPKEQRMFC